jgi:hypothetical protein
MSDLPVFPDFKPLSLGDHDELYSRLWAYQPLTSELTFVNFYIWRSYYHFTWSIMDDQLIILADHPEGRYLLPPVGPAPRAESSFRALAWARDTFASDVRMARVDAKLVGELQADNRFTVTPTRDHFDYVYRCEDLGTLNGRKYSKKRNHINQFLREYQYEYRPITQGLVPGCLALAEVWCKQRLCEEDISLTHELCGIQDALNHLNELHIEGGAILVDGIVQAFALGEALSNDVAVVHIEKANPEFHGIYPMMTREYTANQWLGKVSYINREQDVGELGLRRAKESYFPDHLVDKFEVMLVS